MVTCGEFKNACKWQKFIRFSPESYGTLHRQVFWLVLFQPPSHSIKKSGCLIEP